MIQNKAIVCSLLVLMINVHAMEREYEQKIPGKIVGGSEQQSFFDFLVRRSTSLSKQPAIVPISAIKAALAAEQASAAECMPATQRAGASTISSSILPAGFISSALQRSGAALPLPEIESKSTTVLGEYMQSHPQLYQHVIDTVTGVFDVKFSPNGQIIAAYQSGELIFINSATGAIMYTMSDVFFKQFSPSGQIVALSGRHNNNLILINSATGTVIRTVNDTSFAGFSPNGQIIAAYQSGFFVLINSVTGVIIRTLEEAPFEEFNSSGQIVALSDIYKNNLVLIDSVTGAVIRTINDASFEEFSPNGQMIVAQQGDNLVFINSATGVIIYTIDNVFFEGFSPNGQIVVVSGRGNDNFILIDSATGATIHTIRNACFEKFSPNGQIIVALQANNLIFINSATGAIIYTIDNVFFGGFSPNGQMVVVFSWGKQNIFFINSATGAVMHMINDASLNHISFDQVSPNGQIIVVKQANDLILINNATGEGICRLPNNNGIYFAPDGSSVVSYYLDDLNVRDIVSRLEIRGYTSLREALQSTIPIFSDIQAPTTDGSSAAPAAPHRSVTEPDDEGN